MPARPMRSMCRSSDQSGLSKRTFCQTTMDSSVPGTMLMANSQCQEKVAVR